MFQNFLKLCVGEEQFKYNSFKVIPLKKGRKGVKPGLSHFTCLVSKGESFLPDSGTKFVW